jgi:arylsulfatase A-like enzyme
MQNLASVCPSCLPVILAVLCALAGAGCRRSSESIARAPVRPNLLLLTLDTTRADRLGCYGYSNAVTPNLNGLAEAGVLFEDAQSSVPVTLPSHTTMLTGLQPPEHGVRVNGETALATNVPTLAEILRTRGYRTAAVVASPVLSRSYGLDRGFESYDDRMPEETGAAGSMRRQVGDDLQHAPYRPGLEVAEAAVAWLARTTGIHAAQPQPATRGAAPSQAAPSSSSQIPAVGRTDGSQPKTGNRRPETRNQEPRAKNGTPWFLWVHLYDPHTPYYSHREIFGSHFQNPYDAEVAYMDLSIGRVFDYLGEAGLKEDTIVVAVGDHGEELGDNGVMGHGFFLYRATQRVPLIVTWKGKIKGGTRVASTLSLADLMPTVLDLMGIDPAVYRPTGDSRNDRLRKALGRSFAGALYGKPVPSRTCYMESLWPYYLLRWAPLFALANDSSKFIRAPIPELYDRRSDPFETNNLAVAQRRLADEIAIQLETVEKGMLLTSAISASLTAEDMRRLRSVGYAGGGQSTAQAATEDLTRLVDVKTVKPIISLQSDVRAALETDATNETTLTRCRELVRLCPETALFRTWLGAVYDARKDATNAEAAYLQALQLSSNAVHAHTGIALLYAHQNRMWEAIPHFEQAYLAKPYDAALRDNLALALGRTGIALAMSGHYEPARQCFERVVFLHPDSPNARLHLGNAWFGLGDREKARECYLHALRLQPGYESARRAVSLMDGRLAVGVAPRDATNQTGRLLR